MSPTHKRRNQPTASSPLVRERLARRRRWMVAAIVVAVAVLVVLVTWWFYASSKAADPVEATPDVHEPGR